MPSSAGEIWKDECWRNVGQVMFNHNPLVRGNFFITNYFPSSQRLHEHPLEKRHESKEIQPNLKDSS